MAKTKINDKLKLAKTNSNKKEKTNTLNLKFVLLRPMALAADKTTPVENLSFLRHLNRRPWVSPYKCASRFCIWFERLINCQFREAVKKRKI